MATRLIEQIAKKEKLTTDVLLRMILPSDDDTAYFREKKEELLRDFYSVLSDYDLDEGLIIYCFIRLWREGRVRNFNFYESFNVKRNSVISDYIKHYYDNIQDSQEKLCKND